MTTTQRDGFTATVSGHSVGLSTCPHNCDCCCPVVCKDVQTIECSSVLTSDRSTVVRSGRRKRIRREPPRLGVTKSGRPVTPHKCDLKSPADVLPTPKPSSTSWLRSTSSASIPVRMTSRASLKSNKAEKSSSSTAHDPTTPFAQFKSPTAPRRRPTVTVHNCLGDEHRPSSPKGAGAFSSFLKYLLFAMVLVGVAGTAAAPMLLRKARKACGEIKPCKYN
ncbi:uncharacterized protein LOC125235617 [Leguminivora glycinivorella]|uniref:uncharacterized protein LOC125235617 n=1 Tax=Leguminivora glycinivorella TaxID=1035111 RepID=UPI00200E61EC|nr:uncharacterized protein LOC125235617 [Leguminivora glycinivorella]